MSSPVEGIFTMMIILTVYMSRVTSGDEPLLPYDWTPLSPFKYKVIIKTNLDYLPTDDSRSGEKKIVKIHPEVEENKLAKLLGGKGDQQLPESIRRKLRLLEDRFNNLIEPYIHYRMVDFSIKDEGILRVQGTIDFTSKNLSEVMKHAEKLVCFIGTLGPGIEEEVDALIQNDELSEAYMLDAMGSVAVEDLVDKFQLTIKKECERESKTVTLRFSPGYCDWLLTEQKKLFSLFEPEVISVKLLDSCLMQPVKSISGVFGIVPLGSALYNPCRSCDDRACKVRRP